MFNLCIHRELIGSKISPSTNYLITSIKAFDVESIITALQTTHYNLIKSIKLVNVIFSFQVMLCIVVSYLFTFFTMFTFYKAFYRGIDLHKKMSMASVYWCCYYNFLNISTILTCYYSDHLNDECARLIYKLMNRDICSPAVLRSFGNQVKGQNAKSSCGLFNFDLTLIGMVIKNF